MGVLESAAAVSRVRNGLGDVSLWAEDRLEFAPASILLCHIAHHDYVAWCRKQLLRPIGIGALSQAIVAQGVERYRSSTTRGFFGLRIRSPGEAAALAAAGDTPAPAKRERRVLADLVDPPPVEPAPLGTDPPEL